MKRNETKHKPRNKCETKRIMYYVHVLLWLWLLLNITERAHTLTNRINVEFKTYVY